MLSLEPRAAFLGSGGAALPNPRRSSCLRHQSRSLGLYAPTGGTITISTKVSIHDSDLRCRVKILMERLGSERQTRQRKVTGNGQIALHGTWPHGLNQHCLDREKLIKAVRPSLEKLAKIIGIIIHATMHTL